MSSDYKGINANESITSVDSLIYHAKAIASSLGEDHQLIYDEVLAAYGFAPDMPDLAHKFRENNQSFSGNFDSISALIFNAFIFACEDKGTDIMCDVTPGTLQERLSTVQLYYNEIFVDYGLAPPITITNIPHLDRVKELKLSKDDSFDFVTPVELEQNDSVTYEVYAEYESGVDGGEVFLSDSSNVKNNKYLKVTNSEGDERSHPGIQTWEGTIIEGASAIKNVVTDVSVDNDELMTYTAKLIERYITKTVSTTIKFVGKYFVVGFCGCTGTEYTLGSETPLTGNLSTLYVTKSSHCYDGCYSGKRIIKLAGPFNTEELATTHKNNYSSSLLATLDQHCSNRSTIDLTWSYESGGCDLDISCYLTLDEVTFGWAQSNSNNYLVWYGDDTGCGGAEQIAIDGNNLLANGYTEVIFVVRAHWYNVRTAGNFTVMASSASRVISKVFNAITQESSSSNYNEVARIKFDLVNNTAAWI